MYIRTFRYRFLTIKHYLYLYNTALRYCSSTRLGARRSAAIIDLLNHMWDKFSEIEKKFIMLREEW